MTNVLSSFVAVGFAASIAGCAPPAHGDDGGMSCIKRLRIPIYPALAMSARATGDLAATVLLAPNGSLQTVSFDTGAGTEASGTVLSTAVEKALRASQFAPACGGRTVKVIVKFHIDPMEEVGQPQKVSFEYPNQFEISIPPAPVDAQIVGRPR